jgi:hypothetical protein
MPRARDDEERAEMLACGHPRDGRAEVTFISCGQIYCEVDAGAHTCRVGKHSTLSPFERSRRKHP